MELSLGDRTTADRGRSAVPKECHRRGSEVLIHLDSFSSIIEGSNDLDVSFAHRLSTHMISIIWSKSDKSLQASDALLVS
jgi:hypothetical protein